MQNHDTQETQSLEAPVEAWFVPIAYALILLRANSGLPCVFYGDLYGIKGPKPRLPAAGGALPKLILARKMYAYGHQRDYFSAANCIGWTRAGHPSRSNGTGLAVLITNGWNWVRKRMYVGKHHAGETWTDCLNWAHGEVVIDRSGFGNFHVGYRSVAVWVDAHAENRAMLNDLNLYVFSNH